MGAAALACMASAGCAGKLTDLQGSRSATVQVPAAIAASADSGHSVADISASFSLKNSAWGAVLVESLRVPVSTAVTTQPELPATLKPGAELHVTVHSKFKPGQPASARTISLETKGQPPLILTVQPAPLAK
jgi:hypothetical protein